MVVAMSFAAIPPNLLPMYMINWPGKGNDIYLSLISLTHAQREAALTKAREKTMRFLYFLQTQFKWKHLALADDEFPTPHRLALIPYHREGRRLRGMVRFKVQHISDPFNEAAPLYRTGISVGDYPIDHHHRENKNAPQHLGFYPVPSYNIPLGALIPKQHNGIVVAEKGISVSNIVNGTTRLQPVVMLTGQAAGMLAALAVKNKIEPRQVRIRIVQQQLLHTGAYIMPYYDVKPGDAYFISIQKIGATGILKGKGEPYKWANRTWFYPDSMVNTHEFLKDFAPFKKLTGPYHDKMTISDAFQVVLAASANKGKATESFGNLWTQWGLSNFDPERTITRAELAVLLDKTVHPFELKDPDHNGNFK
jgi:hypothetical protein